MVGLPESEKVWGYV